MLAGLAVALIPGSILLAPFAAIALAGVYAGEKLGGVLWGQR